MSNRVGRLLAIVPLVALAGCAGPSVDDRVKSGDAYAAAGRYAEAIIEYRGALERDAFSGVARKRLAEAYEKANDPAAAAREYIRAADQLPEDVPVQLRAAGLLLAAERFDEARAAADRILARQPEHVDALIVKGLASVGIKDLDRALDELQEAVEVSGDDPRPHAALGILQMMQGRNEEAEAIFKRAVGLRGSSPAPHLALATYYWSMRRFDAVEASLRAAVQLAPDNPRAQRALGLFLVTTGRALEAEAPLKRVAELRDDLFSRLALADYYTVTGRPAQARPILERLAARRDAAAAATTRLAAIDYAAGRTADAHARVDRLLQTEPRNPHALQVKARFLLTERKLDEALARARAAVEADGSRALAHDLLGRVLLARGDAAGAEAAFRQTLALNPQALFARSQVARLTARTDPDQSVQLARQSVAAAPSNRGARLTLARALIARGELSKAEPILQQLARVEPNEAIVHAQMGGLLLAKKDRAGAARAFERALALNPDSIDALSGLVAVAVADGNVPRAQALVGERLVKSPNSVRLLTLSADLAGARGDMKGMEAALRRIVEVDPDNVRAFGSLAALYIRQNRMGQALAEYERVVAVQPKHIPALTMVGLLQEAQGKPADAQKTYERVVSAAPQAAVASNNLAWLYAHRGGNLDQALVLAQTAARAQPQVAQFSHTLGYLYLKKDLVSMAIPALKQAASQDPQNGTYRYHLGLAYAKAGDAALARTSFQAALVSPGFRYAADARRRLDELK